MSRDDDDPADDPAAGYWLRFPGADSRRPSLSAAEPDPFVDRPEIGSADLAGMGVSGAATHVAEVGGVHGYRHGAGRSGVEEREFAEEFGGPIEITADISDNSVSGRIGRIGDLEIRRQHLYTLLRRRAAQPAARPTDYEIRFGGTPIGTDGSFGNMAATVGRPGRAVAGSSGSWSGSFSNRPDADGNPRFVAGTAEAAFEEADGSEGFFRGIFIGVGTPPLPPAARQRDPSGGARSGSEFGRSGKGASPRAGRRLDGCRPGPAAHRHGSTLSTSEEHGIGVHERATPGSGTCKARPFRRPEARQELADRPRSPDVARPNSPAGTDMPTARYGELETADERKRP